jgi:hypothetical protein
MLQQIIEYIRCHAGSWPIELGNEEKLTPMFRFNKEANNVVVTEKIGTVIFWFAGNDSSPRLVTKIMDSSLSVEYIKSCTDRQQEINERIGALVFQVVYDVAEICGLPVVFQEAINKPTYDMELSRAIYGPHGNLALLKKTVARHFKEMAHVFGRLRLIDAVQETVQWGDWAYSVGEDFRTNYGLNVEFLSEDSLNRMSNEINSLSLQRNYVLLDHFTANYFEGPRIVDQIDLSLGRRMANEPGIIDAVRFIIAYFRTSPICGVYRDWLDSIAYSIIDRDGLMVTGLPLRGFLNEVGLNIEEPGKIWSLVMTGFFLRCMDELAFYEHDISTSLRLKNDFGQLTGRLLEIQSAFEQNRLSDISFALLDEDSFMPSSFLPRPPRLAEEGYKGFNIVSYVNIYYALSQQLGPLDLTQAKQNKLKEYQESGTCFIGKSIDEVKQRIDRQAADQGSQHEAQRPAFWRRIVGKFLGEAKD